MTTRNDEQSPTDVLEGARLVCGYDVAEPYSVDEGALYLLTDGTYLFEYASGCSCWDGEYSFENYATFEDFVHNCWMHHGSDFEFEADFIHLKSVAEAY